MIKEKESVLRKVLMLCDGFIVSLSFFIAYFLRQHFHTFYKLDIIASSQVVSKDLASISDYLVALFFVVLLWCLMLYLNGMYRSLRTTPYLEIIGIIIRSAFLTFLAFGAIVFLFQLKFISRIFFAIFMMVSLAFILLEKLIVYSLIRYARRHGYNYRRLLVVGKGRRAAAFIQRIKTHPEWGIKILGAIDDEPGRELKNFKDVKIIGSLDQLPQILHKLAIDEVVFVVPRSRLNHIENAIYICETEGIKATIAVDLFNAKIARARLADLDGIPLVTFETTVATEWQLFIKRTIDLFMSGLAIIILSPLLLIVTMLIKLTSSGPVLFKQKRVGLNGRKFVLFKFRTMHKGADKRLSELKALNEMDGPVFKMKKDPRVTTIGKFLRKFSIDELPQVFNIFAGHMSLIGPRPPLPEEVEQYEPWQRRRLSMRPGLSCLWQIDGRNKADFDKWMKLDLEYLDNWSLGLDFKIIIKTVPKVLSGIGAY